MVERLYLAYPMKKCTIGKAIPIYPRAINKYAGWWLSPTLPL
jgi:hypothetical protein